MDEARFKELVEMVRPVLGHSDRWPLPLRNLKLYMAMDDGEKNGADTFPSTKELLDRWIAESHTDKNAWNTLDLLARILLLQEATLPAELVAWAGKERPGKPRTGDNDANRNRAIRVLVDLLVWMDDNLKPMRNNDKDESACDIVAKATHTTYSNIEGKWNKRPWKGTAS